MQIEIYSDVVCPWCFIGEAPVRTGARDWPGTAQQAHIAWRPFQLNPTMLKEGMDRQVYLDAKFGGTEARRAIEERVAKAGEADGIVFAFDRIKRTPNTFDAHRLIWFAGQQGCQDEVAEALFTPTSRRGAGSGVSIRWLRSRPIVDSIVRRSSGFSPVTGRSKKSARKRRPGIGWAFAGCLISSSTAVSRSLARSLPTSFVSALQRAEDTVMKRKEGA